MRENNKRNSRDDKSKMGDKRTSKKGAEYDKASGRFSDKTERNTSDKEQQGRRRSTPNERSFNERGKSEFSDKKSFGKAEFKPRKENGSSPRIYGGTADKRSFTKSRENGDLHSNRSKSYKDFTNKDAPIAGKRSYIKKDHFSAGNDQTKFADRKENNPRSNDSRPYRKRENGNFKPKVDKGERVAPLTRARKIQESVDDGRIRLNRYIANSGICSRRKADELITAGVVSVNNIIITELGHKVDPYTDEVRYNGELLKREKKIYVLLNKPKDYITTTDDPQERKTVMQLVEKASRERIYPVGRLDRNTTGLLLMTNDGDLADKLSHPRNGITKIYHVELNKNLSQGDFNKIQFGLELEDGLIKPDNISFVAGASKKEIGIQIHSGKNRIVRRIFEHLGYEVVKLDRVVYGNLTKKDLPRGRWRFLEEHELVQIKHLIK